MSSRPVLSFEPPHADHLRASVRSFVETTVPADQRRSLGMSAGFDPDFSVALAERGWVGMSIPGLYGGAERNAVDRWIVTEELLATGAPVSAHWVAERQTAPQLLAFGSDTLRDDLLPKIAAGRLFVSIGMSEPDAGSDLASVRSRAHRVGGGWRLNGRKIWTSGAMRNHLLVVLCRTDDATSVKHDGLSQLVVSTDAEGVGVSAVRSMDGLEHFTEVVFDDVFVPDSHVLGKVGEGWKQVTAELVAERAGPDRYMSAVALLCELFEAPSRTGPTARRVLSPMLARLSSVRRLSFSVAASSDAGRALGVLVPMVKDLGTVLEQDIVAAVRSLAHAGELGAELPPHVEDWIARATVAAPSFTLRGGSTQVLRNLVARGL